MKKLIAILLLFWVGGAAAYWYWNETRDHRAGFRTVAIASSVARMRAASSSTSNVSGSVGAMSRFAAMWLTRNAPIPSPVIATQYFLPTDVVTNGSTRMTAVRL